MVKKISEFKIDSQHHASLYKYYNVAVDGSYEYATWIRVKDDGVWVQNNEGPEFKVIDSSGDTKTNKYIYYIDSINGDDTTGDGTISKPYQSLDGWYEKIENQGIAWNFPQSNVFLLLVGGDPDGGTYVDYKMISDDKFEFINFCNNFHIESAAFHPELEDNSLVNLILDDTTTDLGVNHGQRHYYCMRITNNKTTTSHFGRFAEGPVFISSIEFVLGAGTPDESDDPDSSLITLDNCAAWFKGSDINVFNADNKVKMAIKGSGNSAIFSGDNIEINDCDISFDNDGLFVSEGPIGGTVTNDAPTNQNLCVGYYALGGSGGYEPDDQSIYLEDNKLAAKISPEDGNILSVHTDQGLYVSNAGGGGYEPDEQSIYLEDNKLAAKISPEEGNALSVHEDEGLFVNETNEINVREGDIHLEYSNVSHTEGRLRNGGFAYGNCSYLFESVYPTNNLRETDDLEKASFISAFQLGNGTVKFGMMDLRYYQNDPTDPSTYEFVLIDNFIDSDHYYILEDDANKLNAKSPDKWEGGVYYFLTTCDTLEDMLNDNGSAPLDFDIANGEYQFNFDLPEKSLFSKVLLESISNDYDLQNLYPNIGLRLQGFNDSAATIYDKNLSRISTEHFEFDKIVKVGAYLRNVILTQTWYGSGMADFKIEGEGGKYIELADGKFTFDLYTLFDGGSDHSHRPSDDPLTIIDANPFRPFNLGLGEITSITGTIPPYTVSVLDDVHSLKQKIKNVKGYEPDDKTIHLDDNKLATMISEDDDNNIEIRDDGLYVNNEPIVYTDLSLLKVGQDIKSVFINDISKINTECEIWYTDKEGAFQATIVFKNGLVMVDSAGSEYPLFYDGEIQPDLDNELINWNSTYKILTLKRGAIVEYFTDNNTISDNTIAVGVGEYIIKDVKGINDVNIESTDNAITINKTPINNKIDFDLSLNVDDKSIELNEEHELAAKISDKDGNILIVNTDEGHEGLYVGKGGGGGYEPDKVTIVLNDANELEAVKLMLEYVVDEEGNVFKIQNNLDVSNTAGNGYEPDRNTIVLNSDNELEAAKLTLESVIDI